MGSGVSEGHHKIETCGFVVPRPRIRVKIGGSRKSINRSRPAIVMFKVMFKGIYPTFASGIF